MSQRKSLKSKRKARLARAFTLVRNEAKHFQIIFVQANMVKFQFGEHVVTFRYEEGRTYAVNSPFLNTEDYATLNEMAKQIMLGTIAGFKAGTQKKAVKKSENDPQLKLFKAAQLPMRAPRN